MIIGLLVATAALAGLLIVLLGPRREPPARPAATRLGGVAESKPNPVDPSAGPNAALPPAAEVPAADSSRYLVVDTGQMPWAPPTSGPRPRLEYLPPGSQLVLLARPAELEASDEGRLFLRSLGSEAEAALGRLADWCGCPPAAIESVQAGWQEGGTDQVIGGVAIRLTAGRRLPTEEATRKRSWGATRPVTVAGETYHKGQGLSFWMPSDEDDRVLVVAVEPDAGKPAGPTGLGGSLMEDTIRAAIESRDLPEDELAANLPRDLAVLAGMLDAERHVTLFGTPHYLLNRGRAALAGPLATLLEPLRWFFGESIAAAGLALHFNDQCYLELDVVTPFGQPPRKEAPELFARVASLPSAVEAAVAASSLHPYGKVLVLRLPAMLRLLVANARWAPEGEGVVINAYLPHHAAHNLAVATELTLAQAGGPPGFPVAGGRPATGGDALAKLGRTITIVFPKDTLETAVQMVADQIGVAMEIVGPDLQLEGITKNQSFGLDEQDKPARDVLGVILAKANPDGKLVYVVRKDADGETIVITTRAAAENRGDQLPPGFAPPGKR